VNALAVPGDLTAHRPRLNSSKRRFANLTLAILHGGTSVQTRGTRLLGDRGATSGVLHLGLPGKLVTSTWTEISIWPGAADLRDVFSSVRPDVKA
jgi:hypothetical protein